MSTITTAEQARAQGESDGAEEVATVRNEQGDDVVIATLARGHVGWDEGAVNASAHRLAGVPEEHRDAYYEGYEAAARKAAERVRDEATA